MAKITKATKATNGHNVRVHYKGTLDDGTVFDDSRVRESTLDFELGTGNLIPGFQEAIVGMKRGQTKTFTVDPIIATDENRANEMWKWMFESWGEIIRGGDGKNYIRLDDGTYKEVK